MPPLPPSGGEGGPPYYVMHFTLTLPSPSREREYAIHVIGDRRRLGRLRDCFDKNVADELA
jgi:hypothetical protein